MFQSQRFGYVENTVDNICYHGDICSARTLRSSGFSLRVSRVRKKTVA
jgi:hypothetical protein